MVRVGVVLDVPDTLGAALTLAVRTRCVTLQNAPLMSPQPTKNRHAIPPFVSLKVLASGCLSVMHQVTTLQGRGQASAAEYEAPPDPKDMTFTIGSRMVTH